MYTSLEWPISLLPIFAKVFESLLFNALFAHFHDNDLFTTCQSGFMQGDSCISQLFSIIHEIQSSFDCNPPVDTRAMFLDIPKSFNKVWHQGLLFKLKLYIYIYLSLGIYLSCSFVTSYLCCFLSCSFWSSFECICCRLYRS